MMAMKSDLKKQEFTASLGPGASSPAQDVLLVLVRFNGAVWKSELIQELGIMTGTCGSGENPAAWLDRVICDLQGAGLVQVEDLIRATMQTREGTQDHLISLVDWKKTAAALRPTKKQAPKKRK